MDTIQPWVYNIDIKNKEDNKMTQIKANNKKHFEELIKAYRAQGFNLITLGKKLAELENGNQIIIIER